MFHLPSFLQCALCNFTTAQKSNFVRHMAAKHKMDAEGKVLEESYCCAICNFKSVTGRRKNLHL